ncbi:MAG: hypothetical protein E6R03_01505 [Hyphomicrobiaceae bacterium]|nr:MAG: hypothetical protein E6R03_01505 [Hyphomicrobiaceae bacterium]
MSHPVYDEDGTFLSFLRLKPGQTMTIEEQRETMKTLSKYFQQAKQGSSNNEMGETHAETGTARTERSHPSGRSPSKRPKSRRS